MARREQQRNSLDRHPKEVDPISPQRRALTANIFAQLNVGARLLAERNTSAHMHVCLLQ
jgi:hypothetical protein